VYRGVYSQHGYSRLCELLTHAFGSPLCCVVVICQNLLEKCMGLLTSAHLREYECAFFCHPREGLPTAWLGNWPTLHKPPAHRPLNLSQPISYLPSAPRPEGRSTSPFLTNSSFIPTGRVKARTVPFRHGDLHQHHRPSSQSTLPTLRLAAKRRSTRKATLAATVLVVSWTTHCLLPHLGKTMYCPRNQLRYLCRLLQLSLLSQALYSRILL
jgi:hypothetical protein